MGFSSPPGVHPPASARSGAPGQVGVWACVRSAAARSRAHERSEKQAEERLSPQAVRPKAPSILKMLQEEPRRGHTLTCARGPDRAPRKTTSEALRAGPGLK